MTKQILSISILCFFFIATIYCVHFLNYYNIWHIRENSVISLISSLLFLAAVYFLPKIQAVKAENITILEKVLVFTVGFSISIYTLNQIIAPYPMDKTSSDVIPQMQTLVQRFLNGEFPYTPIQFKDYTLFPTYLPLQWLPFTIAELLHIDYRIFALSILLIVFSVFLSKSKNRLDFYLWSLALYLILPLGMQVDSPSYYNCVENLIAAFYMAFALSLVYSNKIWLQVLLLSFCLFSRYSIVLWVPIYFIYLWVNHGFKKSFLAGLGLFFIFMAVYGLPFLWKDPTIFFKAYEYHTSAAGGEWKFQVYCTENCVPIHLWRGLGMAIFFYDNQNNIPERLAILQKVHLFLSLFSVAFGVFIGLWRKYKLKKQFDAQFLLWTLALYLSIFYHFIQIPYHYLFVVPIFIYAVLLKSTYYCPELNRKLD